MPKPRLQLIANPVAGRQAGPLIARAERRLAQAGANVTLCLTSSRGDAERLAAGSGGYDRIVVAGGDGTVNEVLNGLAPDSPPLAVLPLGTTNVLALEVGLPRDFDRACDLALNGSPTPIHLGLASGRRFALMAGVGFDAAVVRDVDLTLKRRLGKGAYLLAAWRAWLACRPEAVQVEEEDGQIRTGYGLIVAKSRSYGGSFTLTPGASLFDDHLETLLIRLPGRLTLLMAGLALLTGIPLGRPWGERFRSRWLLARGDGVPVQIDGDPAGRLPRSFTINSFPMRLMLPPGRPCINR
ncbi:MAG: diacylglycerol kinase family lipid kinase [Desulfobacteraceae bacterium]|nr:diacylglycerol kinase family lipid kinase [Desulfobacteraceae bacterium]